MLGVDDAPRKAPIRQSRRSIVKFRQLLGAAVIVSVATLGTVGVASAQTTPTAANATKQSRCDKAKLRLPTLEARRTHSEQTLDRLRKAIDAATAKNRTDLVKRLQARFALVQQRHDRIVHVIAKINARCG
jgi:hypothetical protein